ncbi:MAG: DEAD/DEAH box helicase [Candidatus Omnitrophota bacterium]
MIYDKFQQDAINHIKNGNSVIVSAPTGAGKTVIAEYVIEDCLARNTRVIYTAPVKALSNQKFRQFSERFGDAIGIVTGDVSINPGAPVLIMTTEIFRNKLLEKDSDARHYSWVIFDEIHFLDDYDRGSVWEESLIFLPPHMNLLGLSATVPNIDEIARWIRSIHQRPLMIVKEKERPVPLRFFYQCHNEIFDDIKTVKKVGYGNIPHHRQRDRQFGHRRRAWPNRLDSLIKHIRASEGLPCIYFAFGRRRCERLAEELTHRFDFLSPDEKIHIMDQYRALCERFNCTQERSAKSLLPLIERGIAYHHAGMLPTLKEVVERLFTGRLIQVIFTTETFALGINMPARTVAFDDLKKFYGRFHSALKTRDFYQMAGRAGRRGLDPEGFVYSRVNPYDVTFNELLKMVFGEHEEVSSRFNTSYATILHLYEQYGEKLYDIYLRSLHCFQRGKQAHGKALDKIRSKVNILKKLGYIANSAITEKGAFASKIYGYELPLAELRDGGFLEHLSAEEFGILALALVYEPRKNLAETGIPRRARKLKMATDSLLRPIYRLEKSFANLSTSKTLSYQLSTALEYWMGGSDFQRILSHTDADEGGVIRYFRMTIQILREVLDANISDEVKGRIKKTLSLINRDIVDAERQLRL